MLLHVKLAIALLAVTLGSVALWGAEPRSEVYGAGGRQALAADDIITLVPDQLTLIGDVATRARSAGSCTDSWFAGAAEGAIMLGVDPWSCDPASWEGGTAEATIDLVDRQRPTLLVIKIEWPALEGKGIHSPERDRTARITLDGRTLWEMRTTARGPFGDYYAIQSGPILTSFMVDGGGAHTLRFSAPSRTAWDIGRIEVSAHPAPTNIRGIGYSPYRDCQTPTSTLQPGAQDIEEDLFRLAHTSNAIRTYAATGANRLVPALANKAGLAVYAGAWIDNKPTDEDELQALIELANSTRLAGAIVGNEFYLRNHNDASLAYLREQIIRFKAAVRDKGLPVMTAEIDGFMFDWEDDERAVIKGIKPQYKPILDEVSVVLVHIYPYWNGQPIEGAAAYTVRHYNAIRAHIAQVYPGQNKRVIIGETGWPSGMLPNRRAIASPENQLRYLTEFLILAERDNVDFMYFDAFDELWKIEEPGRVGQNWGYSYADRAAKYAFNSVLLPAGLLTWPLAAEKTSLFLPMLPNGEQSVPVYREWLGDEPLFVPSGWMGDTDQISLFECDRGQPHSGEMAIRATFSPNGREGWGGISWQDPRSDWGAKPSGHDLSGARRLSFWVRGERGGEVVEFNVGGIGSDKPYPDSLRTPRRSYPVVLSDRWEKVEIDLTGADLSQLVGGFSWVASRCHNSGPITFYLDDIQFEYGDAAGPPASPQRRFYVYDDHNSGCNHFAPSGFSGDIGDITLDPASSGDTFRGPTAMRVTYSAAGSRGDGWAGVTWQEPERNWGDLPGGFDLRWANKLTFRAKGGRGGECVQFFVGGVGKSGDRYPDSLRPAISTGFVQLSRDWQAYTIDLRRRDLSHVVGGFGWATNQCANPQGATFFLDDIVYEFDPEMPAPQPRPTTFAVYTDAAAPGNHYVPSLWMGDGATPGHVSLTECWADTPHSGSTAIRMAYTDQGSAGWAGVYWVEPDGNVGDRPGGHDLSGSRRLSFWARSETPGATVTFVVGGVGYTVDYKGEADCAQALQPHPDSLCPPIKRTFVLSPSWQRYEIELKDVPEHQLRQLVGGFGWVSNRAVTFYLDDIVFE